MITPLISKNYLENGCKNCLSTVDLLVRTGMGKKGPVVVRFVIMRVLIRVIAGLCRGYPDRSGREGPFLPESISVRSIWLIFRLIRIPMLLWKSYGKSMRRHWIVVGLVIATRPDAVTDDVLDYIAGLSRRCYVCVEYGVESANDEVLRTVNRGHTFAEAEEAIRKTAERGIRIGAHLIFGLPGESRESMLEGAVRVCDLPIQVLKLHQLQIVRGTAMAEQYLRHPEVFRLYSYEEYLDFVVDVIGHIRPDVYLERFVNQSPEEYLIAPKWGIKNYEFVAKLEKRLRERGEWQGRWYRGKGKK